MGRISHRDGHRGAKLWQAVSSDPNSLAGTGKNPFISWVEGMLHSGLDELSSQNFETA